MLKRQDVSKKITHAQQLLKGIEANLQAAYLHGEVLLNSLGKNKSLNQQAFQALTQALQEMQNHLIHIFNTGIYISQDGLLAFDAIDKCMALLLDQFSQHNFLEEAITLAKFMLAINEAFEKNHIEGLPSGANRLDSRQAYHMALGVNYSEKGELQKAKLHIKQAYELLQDFEKQLQGQVVYEQIAKEEIDNIILRKEHYSRITLAYEICHAYRALIAIKKGKVRLAIKYAAYCEYYLAETSKYLAGSGRLLEKVYQKIGFFYLKKDRAKIALDWFERALEVNQERAQVEKTAEIITGSRNLVSFINTSKLKLFAERVAILEELQLHNLVGGTWNVDKSNLTVSICVSDPIKLKIFIESLQKFKINFKKIGDAILLCLLDIKIPRLLMLAQVVQSAITITTVEPMISKNNEPSIDSRKIEQEAKLTRHETRQQLSQTFALKSCYLSDLPFYETVLEQPTLPRQAAFIKWDNDKYKEYQFTAIGTNMFEIFNSNQQKKLKTFAIVADNIEADLNDYLGYKKLLNIVSRGKMLGANRRNKEGFVFFKPEEKAKYKAYGDYDGKLKILGHLGKIRGLFHVVAHGQVLIDNKPTEIKVDLQSIDKLLRKGHCP